MTDERHLSRSERMGHTANKAKLVFESDGELTRYAEAWLLRTKRAPISDGQTLPLFLPVLLDRRSDSLVGVGRPASHPGQFVEP